MLHRGVWPSLYRQGGAARVFDHDDVLKEQLLMLIFCNVGVLFISSFIFLLFYLFFSFFVVSSGKN